MKRKAYAAARSLFDDELLPAWSGGAVVEGAGAAHAAGKQGCSVRRDAQERPLQAARSPSAAALRDKGLAKTASRNQDFMVAGLEAIRGLPPDDYSGEQIRVLLLAQGQVPEPKNHHCWGSLIMSAVKAGVLKPTGEYRPTKSERTHAHKTQIYTKE